MAPVAAADRRGRVPFKDCHANNVTHGFVTVRFALYLLWFRWFLRTTTMPFHHKKIRLVRKDYVGKGWFFITLCSAIRSKLFTTARFCDWVLCCFRGNASLPFFSVHAYCLMPASAPRGTRAFQRSASIRACDKTQNVNAIQREDSTAYLAEKIL
jgi:hypothetical protein